MSTLLSQAGQRMPDRPAFSNHLALALPALLLCVLCVLGWLLFILAPPKDVIVAAVLIALVTIPPVGLFVFLRAASGTRWAILILIFAVVFLSDSTLRAKAAGDLGLDAQSIVKFLIWFSGVALFPWAGKHVASALRAPSLSFLLAFAVWSVCTTAYSVTPAYTFAAALSFFGIWTLAVVAGSRLSAVDALGCVLTALLAALLLSLLMYFVVPDRAMTPMEGGTVLRLSGFFGSPNNMGRAAALALLLTFVYWLYGTRRASLLLSIATVPAAVACMVLSGSRTALTGLVAGLAIVVARRTPLLFFCGVVATTLAVVIFLFTPWSIQDVLLLFSRSGRVSELNTFTGRTQIWQWTLSAIRESPLFGYGFASTRELIPAGYFAAYGWTTTSAHNMWLQAWITTGAIGLVMVAVSQLALLREVIKKAEPVRDSIFAFMLVIGLLEAGVMGPTVNLLTFVWIWGAAISLGSSRERT